MQFLKKLRKIWENIEILNLSQQKEEETIWCQNQIIILQSYTDTDSFIVYVKTDNIYKDIEENVGTRFDTSNYELYRPLPKWKKF